MRNKMRFFNKSFTQKLLITALLSVLILISQQAILLAEENASPVASTATSTTNQTDQPSQNTPSAAAGIAFPAENTSTTSETLTDAETATTPSSSEATTNSETPADSETPNDPDTPKTHEAPDNSANPSSQPAVPAPPTSTWTVDNDNAYYYDAQGNRTTNQWIQDSDGWHYVGSTGAAVSGWFNTPNGKTWYFNLSDPHHPAIIGETEINGKSYYFDESYGLKRNGWVHRTDGSWSWADSDGSLHSDWKYINGKWFYFDTKDSHHRMLTGTFQISSGTYYVDENKGMTYHNWVRLPDGNWAWADWSGAFASGWFNTPNGKTWYFDPFDPHHPALLGEQTIAGKTYFFDEGYGLKRNGWVHHGDGTWSWVDTYGAFQSGWKKIGGTWFYFDPEDEYYRMKTGTFQISSGTYYVDENKGMTYHNWVRLPDGNWAWADWSGAFASGWFNTPNGKTWYFDPFDPHHPALLGEQNINGYDYFFTEDYGISRRKWVTLPNDEKRWSGPDGILTGHISSDGIFTADDGSQPTGIIELPGLKLHVDSNHKVKTGWINEDGITYYYQEDGSSASDWVKINETWYYFDNNGAMQTGWLHLKSGWYYLGDNGKMLTGWIKDGGKDYYLDKNGTMQTGYLTWGNRLYWAGADGAMIEQSCYYPDMYRYAQGYSSATNWLIQVDTTGNRFAVYKGYRGNWVPWYEWRCTTGAPGMWTPHGQFSVGGKGLYFGSGYRCWYYTTITGEYLIHSILYHADGYTVRDGRLGYNGSHGCVRLATSNAKWIYDNIPYGTKIVIW